MTTITRSGWSSFLILRQRPGVNIVSMSTTVSTPTVTRSPGLTFPCPVLRARIFSVSVIPIASILHSIHTSLESEQSGRRVPQNFLLVLDVRQPARQAGCGRAVIHALVHAHERPVGTPHAAVERIS